MNRRFILIVIIRSTQKNLSEDVLRRRIVLYIGLTGLMKAFEKRHERTKNVIDSEYTE